MHHALEWVASGDWLNLALVLGGGLVVAYLSWKTSLIKLLTWPFRWVWSKIKTDKVSADVAKVANVVNLATTDVKKAGNWLTNSRFWKWLAGHDYDPAKHSYLWWIERLGGVAVVLCFTHWYVYGLGVASTPPSADVKALMLDLKLSRHSQVTCQKSWDKCESDYARLVKTDPPSPPLAQEPPDAPTLVDTQPKPLPAATVPPLAKPKVVKRRTQKFTGATAP